MGFFEKLGLFFLFVVWGNLAFAQTPTMFFVEGKIVNNFTNKKTVRGVEIQLQKPVTTSPVMSNSKGEFSIMVSRKINPQNVVFVINSDVVKDNSIHYEEDGTYVISIEGLEQKKQEKVLLTNKSLVLRFYEFGANRRPVLIKKRTSVKIGGIEYQTEPNGELNVLFQAPFGNFVVDFKDNSNQFPLPNENKNAEKDTSKKNEIKNNLQTIQTDSIQNKVTQRRLEKIIADFEVNQNMVLQQQESLQTELDNINELINNQHIQGDYRQYLMRLQKMLQQNYESFLKANRRTKDLLNQISLLIHRLDSVQNRHQVELEKVQWEMENLENEKAAQTERYRTRILGLLSVVILLIVFVYVAWRVTKKLKQQNEQLAIQQSTILEKNEKLAQAYTELQKAQAHMIQSEKMVSIGQLTAGVAHEINNPINYVLAGTETLQEVLKEVFESLEEDIQNEKRVLHYAELKQDSVSLLADIYKGASRTAEIVRNLRIFARLDEDNLKKINLYENIEATLLLLNSLISKNQLHIEKEYAQKLPIIEAFPAQFNQALLNLLLNAIEASSSQGTIQIQTQYAEIETELLYPDIPVHTAFNQKLEFPLVQIAISNVGKDIAENIQERIFEPFFTTKPIGKGTGMGLALVHSVINKHKGNVQMRSKEGKTTLVINLPTKQL